MDYVRRYGIVVVFVALLVDPDGDVAAIPHGGQSAQRPAAELGHRHHRLRHDLRHHLGRVRPVGRGRRGAGQRGRRAADDRVGHPPGHRRGPGRGACAGIAQWLPDRLRRGQPLRGDAGNGDGRARSDLRQHQRDTLLRRADGLHGGRSGSHRSAAERDLDLPGGRRSPSPSSCTKPDSGTTSTPSAATSSPRPRWGSMCAG